MFFRAFFLALPMSFWYLQHKISHSISYQVSDYFRFMLYINITVHVENIFIVFLIELSDSTLNFSPEKLCHTISFIISKTDISCREWENNQYGTLNAVNWKKCYKNFFGHPYRSNGTKINPDVALIHHCQNRYSK